MGTGNHVIIYAPIRVYLHIIGTRFSRMQNSNYSTGIQIQMNDDIYTQNTNTRNGSFCLPFG